MPVLSRRPRSAVADHVCGHSRLVNMRTPARLTGLRGENAPLVTPVGAAAPGGAVYKAVTMATTDSYVTAEIAFPAD